MTRRRINDRAWRARNIAASEEKPSLELMLKLSGEQVEALDKAVLDLETHAAQCTDIIEAAWKLLEQSQCNTNRAMASDAYTQERAVWFQRAKEALGK